MIKDKMKKGVTKGWKLTAGDKEEMKRLRDEGVPVKEIAAKYNIIPNTVLYHVNRKYRSRQDFILNLKRTDPEKFKQEKAKLVIEKYKKKESRKKELQRLGISYSQNLKLKEMFNEHKKEK